jgi:hypothetical protein
MCGTMPRLHQPLLGRKETKHRLLSAQEALTPVTPCDSVSSVVKVFNRGNSSSGRRSVVARISIVR